MGRGPSILRRWLGPPPAPPAKPRNFKRAANKGFRAEQRVARVLKVKKVGGPGRPDFVAKGRNIENKHWDTRAVHAGAIRKAAVDGRHVVNASGRKGFSKGAKALAAQLGIRLSYVKR